MDTRWLDWAKQIQSIAQGGLAYSRDPFDIERFEQLRALSVDIMAAYSDMEPTRVAGLFANEHGYATPKVDIRGVAFRNQKILMVNEKLDGCWSLPGGWADIGLSPKQMVVKEVKEESGFDVQPVRLLAVLDKSCHPHPPSAYHIYKIFIECEIVGGSATVGMETNDVSFFGEDELPDLSEERITASQLRMLFAQARTGNREPVFD